MELNWKKTKIMRIGRREGRGGRIVYLQIVSYWIYL